MSISEAFMNEDQLGKSFEIDDDTMIDLNKGVNTLPLYPIFADNVCGGDKQVDEAENEVSQFEDLSKSLFKSQILANIITPRQIYFNKVEITESAEIRADLTTLYEIGFINFEKNLELLLEHRSVETVANYLMENSCAM